MKNLGLILALCGILAVSNLSAQENNGAFVGFEAGGGSLTDKTTDPIDGSDKETITAVNYGGKVGYKLFFNDWLGLRAYFAIDYAGFEVKNNTDKTSINVLNYTANADALFNFYSNENVNYGAFVGLGLGGVSYELTGNGANENISGFYADFKLGLRTQLGHSGIDFVIGIPFIESKKTILGTDIKIKQDYKIALAYSYTF